MNPFAYPKLRHVRTESPPPWRDYRRYKRVLQREFTRQCVYCRRPDVFSEAAFGVDHYKPKSRFPTLVGTYANLFYCCSACNSHKREFWPEAEELENGYFVPNPCDHAMFSHLRYNGPTVVQKTNAGQCAVDVLDLNDESEIQFRRNILLIIDSLIASRKGFAEEISKISRCLADEPPKQEAESLRRELNEHQQEFDRIGQLLRELGADA